MPLPGGVLSELVRPSELSEPLEGGRLRCLACGHRCPIFDGHSGVCRVRYNRGGILYAPWGYVAGAHADPIEKKPFFHVMPASLAYSFGMLGCDLHCAYCQNWITSQALRDPQAPAPVRRTTPEELVRSALACGAGALVSTYNEPLITAEWAVDVFRCARAAGLATAFVSNGNATPQALEFLEPWLDAYKVDLKSFRDEEYRKLGGRLAPVLDTIRRLQAMGIWLEVVTLLVPGLNDSDDELAQIAGFLGSVSPDLPWHVTAFHPDYKMTDRRATSAGDLLRAAEIGRRAGLRFVYTGNAPGAAGHGEDTRCPGCGAVLIRRFGFQVLENRVGAGGGCPECGRPIPGRWGRPAKASGRQSV
jgi:pyruvate formate lyase activating enzyme